LERKQQKISKKMKKYNILFFSSGRSDYELIKPIINQFKRYKNFNCYLILTGSHLSKKHGKTLNQVDYSSVKQIYKIDIECDEVDYDDLNFNFILAQKKFEKFLKKKKIDLAVILGDRYEALAFGLCCFFQKIKIAHIHGGEITQGAIDDTIRHTLTKLSNIHHVSNSEHKKRVIQLGEDPKTIKIVGLLGLENISKMKFLNRKFISEKLKINQHKKNILISYHPVTKLSKKENIYQFSQLLNSLKKFSNLNIIFTSPNIDPGNKEIIFQIKKFLKKNKNSYFFHSLGQQIFFSLAKESEIFIGNSSSGIMEIPFLNVPVINIGSRQKNRFNFSDILHVEAKNQKITNAIKKKLNNRNKVTAYIKKKNTSNIISQNIIYFLKHSNKFKEKIFYDLKDKY